MNYIRNVADQIATHPAAITPPASVTSLSVAGVPMEEWVYILTAIYTLVNLGWLIYKIWEKYRDKARK